SAFKRVSVTLVLLSPSCIIHVVTEARCCALRELPRCGSPIYGCMADIVRRRSRVMVRNCFGCWFNLASSENGVNSFLLTGCCGLDDRGSLHSTRRAASKLSSHDSGERLG